MFSTTLVCFACFFLVVAAQRKTCGETCAFRLCRANEDLEPLGIGARLRGGAPGDAIHPFICDTMGTESDKIITGDPKIRMRSGDFISLNDWSAAAPSFDRRFFRAKTIPTLGKSGITYKPAMGNQWDIINETCIKLPIIRGSIGGVPVDRNDPSSCVGFTMTAPAMQVSVFWNTDDDVNMRVVQPDTVTVAFESPSQNGIIRRDNAFQSCGKITVGKELGIWSTTFLPGMYCAKLRMKKKCRPGKLRYTISVAVGGTLKKRKSGMANPSSRSDFAEVCFTV